MILIVIYCKVKVKQAFNKLKCDKVPLIVIIFRQSLTAKLPCCIYNSNTGIHSIYNTGQPVSICCLIKGDV